MARRAKRQRARKQQARLQQRLWAEGELPRAAEQGSGSDEPIDTSDSKNWKLDDKTKKVGRAGIAAARKRIKKTLRNG